MHESIARPKGTRGTSCGMLVVETIAKIWRMHFGQGMGIRTICRELNLSKKVVKKVVRSGVAAFSCKRTVWPRPKPGAGPGGPNRLLATNAARASRERLTAMRFAKNFEGLAMPGAAMPSGAMLRPGSRRRDRARQPPSCR